VEKIAVDVGQCNPDHAAIRTVLQSLGVRVLRAHDASEAREYISNNVICLVLVNRILDRDRSSGIELIEDIVAERARRGDANPAHVLLVSNYPEYQEKAMKVGAVKGFGKQLLGSKETLELLSALLSD
jgi:CheY-like chemotaxis protein